MTRGAWLAGTPSQFWDATLPSALGQTVTPFHSCMFRSTLQSKIVEVESGNKVDFAASSELQSVMSERVAVSETREA